MTMTEIVSEYNTMAAAMGRRTVSRFRSVQVGRERLQAMIVAFHTQSDLAADLNLTPGDTIYLTPGTAPAVLTNQTVREIAAQEAVTLTPDPNSAPVPAPMDPLEFLRLAQRGNLSIRQLTDSYNEMVALAAARGIATRAKHHRSLFETKGLALRQVEKLMAEFDR